MLTRNFRLAPELSTSLPRPLDARDLGITQVPLELRAIILVKYQARRMLLLMVLSAKTVSGKRNIRLMGVHIFHVFQKKT